MHENDLLFKYIFSHEIFLNDLINPNLLRLNIDTEDIMKATGLTKKQLEKLTI